MKTTTVEEFYKETSRLMPEEISKEIGHFNVFNVEDLTKSTGEKPGMPYNRRAYYKISI